MARSQVSLEDLSPDEPDDERPARSSSSKRTSSRTRDRAEAELRTRLVACFDRIAGALEAREDEQMAEVIREDAAIMSQGLVSLTRPFSALRTPLLAFVAVIEPALAFGRILRLMAGRVAENRAMRREATASEDPGAYEVSTNGD